jgi:hypothetical protein
MSFSICFLFWLLSFRLSVRLEFIPWTCMELPRGFILGLIGSMPLQLSHFGKMPLQKHNLEKCHYNFSIPLRMPLWSLPSNILCIILRTYTCTHVWTCETKQKKVKRCHWLVPATKAESEIEPRTEILLARHEPYRRRLGANTAGGDREAPAAGGDRAGGRRDRGWRIPLSGRIGWRSPSLWTHRLEATAAGSGWRRPRLQATLWCQFWGPFAPRFGSYLNSRLILVYLIFCNFFRFFWKI